MIVALFALLLVLLALETTRQRVIRMALVLAIAGVAAVHTVELQTALRMCHSDETQTVEFLSELDESSCPIAAAAAQSYLQARENATYGEPFRFGFYNHVAREQAAR